MNMLEKHNKLEKDLQTLTIDCERTRQHKFSEMSLKKSSTKVELDEVKKEIQTQEINRAKLLADKLQNMKKREKLIGKHAKNLRQLYVKKIVLKEALSDQGTEEKCDLVSLLRSES